ncbi:hypothetical protein [Geodermatophilus sp. SYSU D00815]
MTRTVPDAESQDLLLLVDADDLHEADLDADLWNRLPEAPAAGPAR